MAAVSECCSNTRRKRRIVVSQLWYAPTASTGIVSRSGRPLLLLYCPRLHFHSRSLAAYGRQSYRTTTQGYALSATASRTDCGFDVATIIERAPSIPPLRVTNAVSCSFGRRRSSCARSVLEAQAATRPKAHNLFSYSWWVLPAALLCLWYRTPQSPTSAARSSHSVHQIVVEIPAPILPPSSENQLFLRSFRGYKLLGEVQTIPPAGSVRQRQEYRARS